MGRLSRRCPAHPEGGRAAACCRGGGGHALSPAQGGTGSGGGRGRRSGLHAFPREHWNNVHLVGPLKPLDKGAARRQSRSQAKAQQRSARLKPDGKSTISGRRKGAASAGSPRATRPSPNKSVQARKACCGWRQRAGRIGYPMARSQEALGFLHHSTRAHTWTNALPRSMTFMGCTDLLGRDAIQVAGAAHFFQPQHTAHPNSPIQDGTA
jgi:hypothetical protein